MHECVQISRGKGRKFQEKKINNFVLLINLLKKSLSCKETKQNKTVHNKTDYFVSVFLGEGWGEAGSTLAKGDGKTQHGLHVDFCT